MGPIRNLRLRVCTGEHQLGRVAPIAAAAVVYAHGRSHRPGLCDDCHLGARNEGALFFGAYKGGALTRVRLSEDRLSVTSQRVVATPSAMVLSLERAPDGSLYYSTYTGIFRLHLAPS